MIQAIVLKLVKDKLTSELIKAVGITKENVNDSDIEDKIVEWLNSNIDIPFVSEKAEEDIIITVLAVVKFVIMEEL